MIYPNHALMYYFVNRKIRAVNVLLKEKKKKEKKRSEQTFWRHTILVSLYCMCCLYRVLLGFLHVIDFVG